MSLRKTESMLRNWWMMINIQQLDRLILVLFGFLYGWFVFRLFPAIWQDLKDDIRELRKNSPAITGERLENNSINKYNISWRDKKCKN